MHSHWFVFALCLAVAAAPAWAQKAKRKRTPNPAEVFDPTRMLDAFLGKTDVDHAKELEKISISEKEERTAGEQAAATFKQQLEAKKSKVQTQGDEVEYLEKLLALLQPRTEQARRYRKIRVYYFDDADPQAWCLPGGHIFISSGMLKGCASEAALVCVLGHELAHLECGHLLVRLKQAKLLQQRMPGTGEFSFERMFQSFDAMQHMFRRPFGPDEELAADRVGITWAHQLGYDPLAIEGLYDELEKPGAQFMPAFLRSHPSSAQRRLQLKELVAKFDKESTAGYVGRENLKRRIPRSEREFDE
jgi:predicted Zn-dependent protease